MQRVIHLEDIKNGHVFDVKDSGLTKDGNPTSRRQELMRLLKKRIDFDGGADGIKQLAQFRVVSVSEWKLEEGERAPFITEQSVYFEDALNTKWSKDMFDLWKQKQKEFLQKNANLREQITKQAEAMAGKDLATAMTALTAMISQNKDKSK